MDSWSGTDFGHPPPDEPPADEPPEPPENSYSGSRYPSQQSTNSQENNWSNNHGRNQDSDQGRNQDSDQGRNQENAQANSSNDTDDSSTGDNAGKRKTSSWRNIQPSASSAPHQYGYGQSGELQGAAGRRTTQQHEDESLREVATTTGTKDHRTGREIAIEMLKTELGATEV